MFKGFETDSLTVPSCEKHNSQKSGLDQAVVAASLISLEPYSLRFHSDVRRAIEEGKSSVERAKRKAYSAQLISDLPGLPTTSYLAEDIIPWIRQLVAGFIYNATNHFDATIQWDKVEPWSPAWLPFPYRISQKEFIQLKLALYPRVTKWENFRWVDGWSSHPRPYPKNIFRFQLYIEPKKAFFRFVFYEQIIWYVEVSPSRKTLKLLKKKVGI